MSVESGRKTSLLFLCHRIPFPPNKGDKIRSFHLLEHLSRHFDVYLGTFVDDAEDWPYRSHVEEYCKEALFLPLPAMKGLCASLSGFFTGDALSIPYYRNAKMKAWVRDTLSKHSIEHAIVYSSAMAQFLLGSDDIVKRKIVDFVDVDSDKWQQYADQKSWPMSWLYRRESRYLLAYEKMLSEEFDAGLFVSSAEAEHFKSMSPETAHKISFYNNGVNTEYFSPSAEQDNPYPAGSSVVVFTGAMDYWPNVDAVVWFVNDIFPALRARCPDILFYIVGGNPTKAVTRLSSVPGVTVTGRVEDIRPYMHFAVAAVAPMRVARGVQNKVLEGMAMEKPVVLSSKGLEGIDATHTEHLLIADEIAEYVEHLDHLMKGAYPEMGKAARQYVTRHFNWEENLPEVVFLLEQPQKAVNKARFITDE
jgi:sugar transferase (PEP-CTERM/EpsH1 system associated)